MTPEQREELAALLALDCLEGDELEQALRLRRDDPEFAALVDELEQTAMLMVETVAPVTPAPALKRRLLEQLDAESATGADDLPAPGKVVGLPAAAPANSPPPVAPAPTVDAPFRASWIGWAAALALALAIGWLLVDRRQLLESNDRLANSEAETRAALVEAELQLQQVPQLQGQLAAARSELAETERRSQELAAMLDDREMELATATAELEDSATELARLRQRDQLARTRIASLEATLEAYQTARVVVIWDEETKRGVVQIEGLPELDAEQDYQFWVVDPNQEQPVDAGTIELDETGSARVDFEPRRPIAEAAMFAISIEAAGGVPFNEGPIILAGR